MRELATHTDLQTGEILVKTNDDKTYAIERVLFRHSKLIHDILADIAPGQEPDVPLAEVSSESLSLIIKYLQHYREITPKSPPFPMPTTLPKCKDIVQFDKEFMEKEVYPGGEADINRLKFLMNAANFLAIATLRDLCCVGVADFTRGKDPMGIIKLFGSKLTSYGPEDEERGLELLPQFREYLRPKDKEAKAKS